MISYLLDLLLYDKPRADEVREVRRQLRASPAASRVGPEEAGLGRELRALRVQLSHELGSVQACRSCARGHPLPYGRWEGGHCCGGTTRHLFTNDEIASLRVGGTRGIDLRAPRGPHAGCAFRGPRGCSLRPEHRPNLCVRYTCPALRAELRDRGDLEAIDRLADDLLVTFTHFVQIRGRRRDEEVFDGLPEEWRGIV